MSKKIIFSSGGTGGHIFPAINLMKHFSKKGYEVLLVTDERGKNFLKNYPNFKSYIIKTSTPINKSFFIKIFSYITIFFSILRSIIILSKEKPNLIIGLGGYVSFPIAFASRFFKLPLIIYENNIFIGRANMHLLSLCKKILFAIKEPTNFPEKYKNKFKYVGFILDKDIINYSSDEKIENKNFSILVLGGSQGAEIFGEVIPSTIKLLKEQGYNVQITQQCISSQKESIVKFYEKNKIKNNVFEFNENILKLISSADLAISRCGASTTAALVHMFTPFIAVPIPKSIDNHQYLNGKYCENKGYCWLLEQKNFNSENLYNLIIKILEDKKQLEFMHQCMKKNDNKNVYNNIDNAIEEFL